jgi:hypothetical protein
VPASFVGMAVNVFTTGHYYDVAGGDLVVSIRPGDDDGGPAAGNETGSVKFGPMA